jgi:nucleoside-diphosphate-sugar epimerase
MHENARLSCCRSGAARGSRHEARRSPSRVAECLQPLTPPGAHALSLTLRERQGCVVLQARSSHRRGEVACTSAAVLHGEFALPCPPADASAGRRRGGRRRRGRRIFARRVLVRRSSFGRVKVLIAGCGYVGVALGLALNERGHEVWGLRRDASLLPAGIRPISADLGSPRDLAALPRDLEQVVYCAGADESSDAAYERAYVEGPRHLLDALRGSAVQRFFFTSSTAVYAQGAGEWVDESSETAPQHFSGQRLLEGERLIGEQPIHCTILRCSGIYGPGRTRLVQSVLDGSARVSERITNRIHRDDIAGAIVHLIATGQKPRLLLLSDDEPAPERDVLGYLARCLLVPEPPHVTPPASALPARGSKRCSNARLRATGYRLRHPSYREGYAALIAELAARGQLRKSSPSSQPR